MNRRGFLTGLSGLVATSLTSGFASAGHDTGHPMQRLLNINTGQNFSFEDEKFNLVIVMTAQESYPDCGSTFIGMHMIMNEARMRGSIRPVMIMPRVADQTAGNADTGNLSRALSSEHPYHILSGSLDDINAAIGSLNGAFLELDAQGKVNGHTQDAFFLTPSGTQLLRHSASDYFNLTPLVDQITDRCSGWFPDRELCK